MHTDGQISLLSDPHLLGAVLLLCTVVAATRVLRDIATSGTVWWGIGQVGGALCASLLAGLLTHEVTDNGAVVLAAMMGAAWLGAEIMDRLSRHALRWIPKVNGNGNGH